jgi:putative flippase GtrA
MASPIIEKAEAPLKLMFARYLVFALIGTSGNLSTQEIVIRILPMAPLSISILAGTIAGFILKYVLDKHWVFRDAYGTHRDELRKISLYGAFSVFTTLIFWAFELSFFAIWHTEFAKYLGAAIGLMIGYTAKFLLDRTYVFKAQQP